MTRDSAVRASDQPIDRLTADLRGALNSRRHPPGTSCLDTLTDVLVHTQDIAVPLGNRVEMPPAAAHTASDHVWRRLFPHRARQRLGGLRIEANDVEWARGDGPLVEGPIGSVLMLLTGRAESLKSLDGDGLPEARTSLNR